MPSTVAFPSFLSAVAAALLGLVLAASPASATSCGEPRLSATDKCSDWQCSRVVYPAAFTATAAAEGGGGDTVALGIPDEKADGTYFGHGICVRGLGEGSKCHVDDDCFVKKFVCRNTSTPINNGSDVEWALRCVKGDDDKIAWQGYLGVVIAVVGFGTNFVPAKQVRSGNGMLFQLAQCCGVIIVGICTALITKTYVFYPMSLIGGMLWCLGNCLCVPVIQLIGLGVGLSVWGTMNMLVGWASGRFGFMGVIAETAPTPWRSYCGVGVAIIAICAFATVRPSPPKKKDDEAEREALLNSAVSLETVNYGGGGGGGKQQYAHVYAADEAVRRGMDVDGAGGDQQQSSSMQRRILGLVLAVVAGIFFRPQL